MNSAIKILMGLCMLALAGMGFAREDGPLDLKSVPLADWLNAGEHVDIPWDLKVHDSFLRMDQLLEVPYYAHIEEKELEKDGPEHDLFFISRVSTTDGEWLGEPNVARYAIQNEPGRLLPAPFSGIRARDLETQYSVRLFAQPGDYTLWVVLYDRATNKHNFAKRRFHVDKLRKDPLPDLYLHMPMVRFPEALDTSADTADFVSSQLYLPVRNKRSLEVDLIPLLSAPDQWASRMSVVLAHNDDSVGALRALSQMKLSAGSLSITGLDLVRRQVPFEQNDFQTVAWPALRDAIKKAQSPAVSIDALEAAKKNSAFFRDFMTERLYGDKAANAPFRVIILVGSSQLFKIGSDLRPMTLTGDCRCRVYYLRFRLTTMDVLDELGKLIKPLQPHTFDVLTAIDMRKAIAGIVQDLESL